MRVRAFQLGNKMLNKRKMFFSATLVLMATLMAIPSVTYVNAGGAVPKVCVAALNKSCPKAPLVFTGTVGGVLSIFISLVDKTPFNSFDVIVGVHNTTFLNPLNASTPAPHTICGGGLLAGCTKIRYCVNGVDMIGGGCVSQDTAGTVELFIGSTSFTTSHTSSGGLIQVDFQILKIPSAPISISIQGNQVALPGSPACSPSSLGTPPPSATAPYAGTCFLLLNGGSTPVPIGAVVSATFS